MRQADQDFFDWFEREVAEGTEHILHNGQYLFANGARLEAYEPLSYEGSYHTDDVYNVRKQFLSIRIKQVREHYETWHRNMREDAARCAATGEDLPFTEKHVAALTKEKELLDRYVKAYEELTAPEREQAEKWNSEEWERLNKNKMAATRMEQSLKRLELGLG